MVPRIIGPPLLDRDAEGRLRTRIATVFPRGHAIVTLPGIHATQRVEYTEYLNRHREQHGLCCLSEQEQEEHWLAGVDLVIDEDGTILIRPDPAEMSLTFEADELLQELFSKKQIRFLHVLNPRVHEAIKRRGELWRICPLPRSPQEMAEMITSSKIAIGQLDIYYYNSSSGTRLLTCQDFTILAQLEDEALRAHLMEIREYAARVNRMGNPEIDFFMTRGSALTAALAINDFATMPPRKVREVHESLVHQFRGSVPSEFRYDDLSNPRWRSAMYAALIGQTDKAVSEESLLGLSAEFYMQMAWVPGARIDEGELMFDSVFSEEDEDLCCSIGQTVCDFRARELIFNFMREFGDLEYVNIGRVAASISHRHAYGGQRAVYLAEMKQHHADRPILRIIRMQKRGVWDALDQGKDLLSAIVESETYTEQILDRRLACRQLGMNLPPHLAARKLCERYLGRNPAFQNQVIWSTYFERDYVAGLATDKIPAGRFADDGFAVAFAQVLGRAAAPNLIVGRSNASGDVTFDDGDELVVDDQRGLPADIVVTDQTGTFGECQRPLAAMISHYAAPVHKRQASLSNVRAFAETYVHSFMERFQQIQRDYQKRARAFETLFERHRAIEAETFRSRWRLVLQRLAEADPKHLSQILREKLELD